MKTIMFQGDSITDGGRYKDQPTNLGAGYPCLVSSKLGRAYPEQYNFVNRAISGNKVTDLIGRWKRDCLNMKPDYLTILVGVNDVWHELVYHDGTDTGTFKKVYDILLENTRKALPDTEIVLMEPYVLEDAMEESQREVFKNDVAAKRQAVRELAEKYGLATIPLQDILNEALKEAPATYWTVEGVHPTWAGHQIICDAWVETFKQRMGL